MARLQQEKQAAVTTGSAGSSGIPRATVLTLIRTLLGAPGLLATVIRGTRNAPHRGFDTSVGVSGPYDFASASRAVRPTASTRPSHPALNTRDDREAPLLIEAGCEQGALISEKTKAEYFSPQGWTAVMRLRRLAKSAFWRGRFRSFLHGSERDPATIRQIRADLQRSRRRRPRSTPPTGSDWR